MNMHFHCNQNRENVPWIRNANYCYCLKDICWISMRLHLYVKLQPDFPTSNFLTNMVLQTLFGEITNSIILKICSCFQKLEYIASGRDTNGEELSIISNLKSQVDNRVRDIINNVIRVESNLEKTDSKLSTVETRMKKYAIKLSRLSRNLTSIQKLSSQIQALK